MQEGDFFPFAYKKWVAIQSWGMFRNSVFLGPLEQVSSWWIENLSKVSKTDFSHFTLRGFQRKKVDEQDTQKILMGWWHKKVKSDRVEKQKR